MSFADYIGLGKGKPSLPLTATFLVIAMGVLIICRVAGLSIIATVGVVVVAAAVAGALVGLAVISNERRNRQT